MNRGEVWWGEVPHEGRRPYLILSRQSVVAEIQRVIAIPITSNARRVPSELVLDIDDGMPRECVASFDNISHYSKSLFTERICTLGPAKLDAACRALAIATGCRSW